MAENCVKQFKLTNHSPGLMDYKVNVVLQHIVMACHVMNKAYQVCEGNKLEYLESSGPEIILNDLL